MNFNDVAIVSIKGSDYRIHFWYMNKIDATDQKKYQKKEQKISIENYLKKI